MAKLDIAIHQRVRNTKFGRPALKYFDAPTMKQYQIPHKGFQSVFCKGSDGSERCKSIISYEGTNIERTTFEVRMNGVGDGNRRGVFSKSDIQKGSVIAAEVSHEALYFSPAATEAIYYLKNDMEENEALDVWKYMDGYGWETSASVSSLPTLSNSS